MFIDRTDDGNIISCLFKSSNILSSDYNKDKKELTIVFKEGRNYTYSDINHKDYTRFELAESQGEIFSKYIKKYPNKKNSDINPTEILTKISNIINESNTSI